MVKRRAPGATGGAAPPRVFVSYSWEDAKHRRWVKSFAARLRADGLDVTLDAWAVAPGDQLPQFMETAVRNNDYVLIVCTPRYKAKSDSRTGGVGYEGDIMTAEVMTKRNHRKFVPILRRGTWSKAAPSWLLGKSHVDLRRGITRSRYDELLQALHGRRAPAPPIGSRPQKIKPPTLRTTLVGVLVGYSGHLHIGNEWFWPNNDQMMKALRGAGLAAAIDSPQYPSYKPEAPVVAGMHFTAGYTFIMNASMNAESVAVVAEELWPRYLQPFFADLKKWLLKWSKHGHRVGFGLEVYFRPDNVVVATNVATATAAEAEKVQRLIPEAQWRALKWVEERGITAPRMTYTIESASLVAFPRLHDHQTDQKRRQR